MKFLNPLPGSSGEPSPHRQMFILGEPIEPAICTMGPDEVVAVAEQIVRGEKRRVRVEGMNSHLKRAGKIVVDALVWTGRWNVPPQQGESLL